MLHTLIRTSLLAAMLVASAPFAADAVAQAPQAKVPTTVDDHLALAKTYQEKAATYRNEARYHRDMLEEYKKTVATSVKAPGPNPWVVKMQKHCQMLAKDADKLAADAEKAAEYHALRAKELQGQ